MTTQLVDILLSMSESRWSAISIAVAKIVAFIFQASSAIFLHKKTGMESPLFVVVIHSRFMA